MKGRLVKIAGYAILGFCLIFLGLRFSANFDSLIAIRPGTSFYLALLFVCLGYGGLQLFIVAALGGLLRGFGADQPVFSRVLNFHGRTNIAKYIPGNIFHFAGRQMLAVSYGWPQETIALVSLVETVLVALGAGLAAILFAAASPDGVSIIARHISPTVFLSLGAALVGLWFLGTQAGRIPVLSRFPRFAVIQKFSRSSYPMMATGLYLFFFIGGGLLLWVLASALTDIWRINLIAATGFAYVASWLVGYISVGAPGGLGVREAILVILLNGVIGEPEALLLGIGLRIATVFGDLFLLAVALLFRPRH